MSSPSLEFTDADEKAVWDMLINMNVWVEAVGQGQPTTHHPITKC
jgi:hypothetical protein